METGTEFNPKSIKQAVEYIVNAPHAYLHKSEENKLRNYLGLATRISTDNTNTDLLRILDNQLGLLEAEMNKVSSEKGSARDVKDIVTSTTPLISTIVKLKSEIINMDRLQKIEQVVVEVMSTFSPEQVEMFKQKMKEKLP